MDMHELLAWEMVKERTVDALREAEQRRGLRCAGAARSARFRLGRALVWLGQWLAGQSSPAPS